LLPPCELLQYNVITQRKYVMNKTDRDNPPFVDADGWIEVIADNTAVIGIEPPEIDDEESDDDLMMCLFLDFAIEQALKNQNLVPYTLEMSAAVRDLIEGVELDDELNSIEPEPINNMQYAGIFENDRHFQSIVNEIAAERTSADDAEVDRAYYA
jgi:antitoxin PrlF